MNAATVTARQMFQMPFKRRRSMTKLVLALGGVAVALTAMPAQAQHRTGPVTCAHRHHGRCEAWRPRSVGFVFGPSYAYTDYGALPQPIVSRYHLRHNYRYVNENGYVYVVNPRNYRVVRVIRAPM
jgi:hypothetical protein